MTPISLETSNGPCAVPDLSGIAFVSCPFVKGKLPASRRIGLHSGLVFFVLDNATNYETLRPVLPASWGDYTPYQEPEKAAQATKATGKPKASRGRPTRRTEAPAASEE